VYFHFKKGYLVIIEVRIARHEDTSQKKK